MKRALKLLRDPGGATLIEFAFGFPVLILLIWMIYQFGLVFRANSGIQHALGEGARDATLWPTPAQATVKTRMQQAVYGIGPGNFTVFDPVPGTQDGSTYWDLRVRYTQSTNMLLFPGPDITLVKTKRVWVAPS